METGFFSWPFDFKVIDLMHYAVSAKACEIASTGHWCGYVATAQVYTCHIDS